MENLPVEDFVNSYNGVEEAALALGVTRQTLWEWRRTTGLIPDKWAYKASHLLSQRSKEVGE